MDEKRKPYATIMIRKPRISLLLSAILVVAIAAVAAAGILQERSERAAELEILQQSLETTQNLVARAEMGRGEIEDKLRAAESRLADYHKQFAEPAGYYDYSDGRGRWLRLYSCSTIVLNSFNSGNGDGASLVSHNVLDRKIASDLTRRDNYSKVGDIPWTPEGEKSQTIDFYIRQDVLAGGDFAWPNSDDWAITHRNWEDYLDDYCQQL